MEGTNLKEVTRARKNDCLDPQSPTSEPYSPLVLPFTRMLPASHAQARAPNRTPVGHGHRSRFAGAQPIRLYESHVGLFEVGPSGRQDLVRLFQ